jgi:hypothetical protein
MTEKNPPHNSNAQWCKSSMAAYVIVACVIILSYFLLRAQMERYVNVILGCYGQLTVCFAIFSFALVPFRLRAICWIPNSPTPHIRERFGLLVPIIDLVLEPLFDVSLFYSSLFILYAAFEEHMQGLSVDSFLILLVVASILLFQSIKDVYEMSREIFHVDDSQQVQRFISSPSPQMS